MRDLPASIRQRLLNLARARGEDFSVVLTGFGLERLMYRIAQSPHRREFVLKGAMLIRAWTSEPHRPTRDLDFLGRGEPDILRLEGIFNDIWRTPVADDGVQLEPGSIRGEEIREAQEYGGIRMKMVARLGNARIPIQVDIGFGDAVTPGVKEIAYPVLLDFPSPRLYAYPRETVVAEKLQAMVLLGAANTRMKDFFDVWLLARGFTFGGATLARAIAATFRRRKTPVPADVPLALTSGFAGDRTRQQQWSAFLRRIGHEDGPEFTDVVSRLAEFLVPALHAIHMDVDFLQRWPAGGPWQRPE